MQANFDRSIPGKIRVLFYAAYRGNLFPSQFIYIICFGLLIYFNAYITFFIGFISQDIPTNRCRERGHTWKTLDTIVCC
nr:hypothetical protein Iba_chr15bCG3090 [Ipomoea batatas]